MNVTWVSWENRGSDPYTNPKAGTAHAAINVGANHVRNGSFPLACGRWAPDGFDANIAASSKRHCRRCEKAVAKRKREERHD